MASAVETSDVVVIASSATDDDLPLVDFQPAKPPKRPRGAPRPRSVKSPPPVSVECQELCSPSYSSVEAVKAALVKVNESCVVRLRSTCGRFVRFGCKAKGCSLNVSGKKIAQEQSLLLTASTYVNGTCSRVKCASCIEVLCHLVSCFRCSQGHHLCDECFSQMVSTQVLGLRKAAFMAKGSVINCYICETGGFSAPINMHQNINRVHVDVWQQYLTAITETAVVAEQKRVQPLLVSKPPSHVEQILIDVASLTLPCCSQCQRTLPDFDGCLALVCGRTSGNTGGDDGLGCGAHLCGYCQRSFADEWAVHRHLKDECTLNPRPGVMYPGQDVKEILSSAARERVWYFSVKSVHVLHISCAVNHFCCRWHVMIRAETAQVDEVFSLVHEKWPELGLTEAWCATRLRWTVLCGEMNVDPLAFSSQLPLYMRCAAHCVSMGFPEEAAMRASILQKGNVTQACIVLIENPAPAQ